MKTQEPFTLPEISFLSGTTQEFLFDNFFGTEDESEPFDLRGCTALFSVTSFINKTGAPILEKSMSIVDDSQSGVPNTLRVILTSSDTANWSTGKYIYEVAIRDVGANFERMQGILLVYNNINPSFVGL